jgi:uncharacterized protein YbaP (TraB family)
MYKKFLLLACALFVLSGSAAALDAPSGMGMGSGSVATTYEQKELVPPRRGTLYSLTYNGKTSYLFGTIHVGKQGEFPLNPEVMQALASTSELVLELDNRKSSAFYAALEKHGQFPVGDSIDKHLSAAAYDQLKQALVSAGIAPAMVARYRPWLIANVLVGRVLEKRGYQSGQGVESHLLSPAQVGGKKVVELESADYQLALFDRLSQADEETYMLETLADLADGNALRKTEGMFDAWNRADDDQIDQLMLEMTTGNSVSSTFMQQTLLGRRNQEMANNIEHIIKDNKVAFVGVGLLHMAGDNGLPQLLKKRGYDIRKVQ